jgi:hypothetical protein
MTGPRSTGPKRPRDSYSRLICLGCRERRIRCELPSEVEIPGPGELRTVQTPCYRCKRLGTPCVIRQTILGRPSPKGTSTAGADSRPRSNDVNSQILIKLPSRTELPNQPLAIRNETRLVNGSTILSTRLLSSTNLSPNRANPIPRPATALLLHVPQSPENAFIIRAVDTLRCENVQEEWFRHLPARYGNTRALDLSVKAIVAACDFARGVPEVTSRDCYRALALALADVHASLRRSKGEPNDDILASTALLAPFEGILVSKVAVGPAEAATKRHGVPTRSHIEGLAASLAARPTACPATQLARDILDFYAGEAAVIACIQGTPSPFEGVGRAYYAADGTGSGDNDQARLKALANELFIRIPRLVGLVRSLRRQQSPQNQLLLEAFRLSHSLLKLEDSEAEERLLRRIEIRPSSNSDASPFVNQSLHCSSGKEFEALAYYWQSRLSLLRLDLRLRDLAVSKTVPTHSADESGSAFWPSFTPNSDELFRLVKNVLMCLDHAKTLRLRKHDRLFAHAMVVVWGVKMDVPGRLSSDQDGKGVRRLSDLLLRSVNRALAAKLDFTAQDMDAAADIFVGGQAKGRYAELYGL